MNKEKEIRSIAKYLGCNEGELVSEVTKILLSQRQEMIKEIKERGELVYLPEDEKPTWHITDEALKEVFGECPMKGRMCQCSGDEECIHLSK